MNKITRAGIGMAAVAAIAATGALVAFAWGPVTRETYTLEKPAHKVTFNSITNNNKEIGDERFFVSATPHTGNAALNEWTDYTEVESGKEYVVRMYVHNNAASNLKLTAKDVKAYINLPTTTGTKITVSGTVESSNADPKLVYDDTHFISKNGKEFNLAYVEGSAKYYNKAGTFNLDTSVFTKTGQLLGYDKMDGNIPGCIEYSGYLTFHVKAQFAPDLQITKQVKLLGTDTWSEEVEAKAGDTVRYKIEVRNDSDVQLNNVRIRDILPTGLTYVKNTTLFATSTNKQGSIISDNIVTDEGINTGTYGAHSKAFVYFNATVDKSVSEKCGNTVLSNIAQTSAGAITGTREDTADVVVKGKVCKDGFTIDKKVKNAAGEYVETANLKAGETAHYRIEFKNTGDNELKNVVIKDTLPANMTYVKGSTKIGDKTANDGIVSGEGLNIGSVAAKKSVYIYFDATTAKALGDKCETTTLTNTVKGSYNKDDKTSKTDTAVVKVEGKTCKDGFTIDKKVKNAAGEYVETANLKAGETAHYRIEFKNTGDNELKNVVIKDTLPANMTYVKGSTKIGDKTANDGIVSGEGLNIGSVAAKKSVYIYFDATTAKALGDKCETTTLTNIVEGKYNNDDKTSKTDTAVVKVDGKECKDGFIINKMVQIDGGKDWSENVTVKAGDKVRYRIQFENNGETTLKNVVIRDLLPSNMTYVKGSTILYNSANNNGKTLADGIVSAEGVNIGDYAKKTKATIYFYATVNASLKDNCNDSVLTNIVKGKYNNDNKTEKSDTANVTVPGKNCEDTPYLPETGAGEVLSGVLGLAAISTAAGYYIISRKK